MRQIANFWRMLNLPCDQVALLISTSFDRDLTRLERLAWRSHVVYCAACRRYLRQLRFLGAALVRLRAQVEREDAVLPGPALPFEVRERIRSSLRQ